MSSMPRFGVVCACQADAAASKAVTMSDSGSMSIDELDAYRAGGPSPDAFGGSEA